MEVPATGEKSAEQSRVRHEDRGTWIFTAYAICGLAFFGVLAYYTSVYFAR
jgi:hypothetical protein